MSGLIFTASPGLPFAPPPGVDAGGLVGLLAPRAHAGLPERGVLWVRRWEDFDRSFAWERRGAHPYATAMGVAARSFFAQGGGSCAIVYEPPGDAWEVGPLASADATQRLVPEVWAPAHARERWMGLEQLEGLPDVALVSIPDLVEHAAMGQPAPLTGPQEESIAAEWRICETPNDLISKQIQAAVALTWPPRADEAGLLRWAALLRRAVDWIAARRRDVTLIAGLPLAAPGGALERDLFGEALRLGLLDVRGEADGEGSRRLGSAHLSLAWPWLRTEASSRLPGGLEEPGPALMGLLCRRASEGLALRSAVGAPLREVNGLSPELSPGDREGLRDTTDVISALQYRISVFSPEQGAVVLRSDLSTHPASPWRFAACNRLHGLLLRRCRQVGEAFVFAPSGPETWRRVRLSLELMLSELASRGLIGGAGRGPAFSVRCDPRTMTQQDLDAGRLIAAVEVQPTLPVERIVVELSVDPTAGANARLGGVA